MPQLGPLATSPGSTHAVARYNRRNRLDLPPHLAPLEARVEELLREQAETDVRNMQVPRSRARPPGQLEVERRTRRSTHQRAWCVCISAHLAF